MYKWPCGICGLTLLLLEDKESPENWEYVELRQASVSNQAAKARISECITACDACCAYCGKEMIEKFKDIQTTHKVREDLNKCLKIKS